MNRIYFDHAATTPLDKRVLEKMTPYFCEMAGNANSQHYFGREAMKAVDEARDKIATLIGAKPSEIYFTSGGTEADNWALRGAAAAYGKKGKHFIISKIEHAAMLSTAADLEKQGIRVSVDDRNEKIGYKIRAAQMEKIPYMLVIGEKEMTEGTVAVRSRKKGDMGVMSIAEFIAFAKEQIDNLVLDN